MIFIHKSRTCTVTGQSIIQERLHVKIINKIVNIKNYRPQISKWADVLGRAASTNGSRKMRDKLIFLIVLLSKESLQVF